MKIRKNNYNLASHIKCLTIICVLLSFSVIRAQKSIGIDVVNKPYHIKFDYYKDSLKIGNPAFKLSPGERPRSGVSHWSAFYINPEKDVVLNYLEFSFPVVNSVVIYAPTFTGSYVSYTTGMSHPIKKVADMRQTSELSIDAGPIDFSRPFVLKNTSISIFGVYSFHKKVYVTGYDKKPKAFYTDYNKQQLEQANSDFEADLLFGMLIISFIFVLTFYIIHRKIYFLFYALYLFSLIVAYSSWAYYFYFYNIYSNYHDYLYLYLSLNGEILAIFWYMLFLKQFIGIKQNYPELHRLYQVLLYTAIPFTIIYNSIVLPNPYYPGFDTLSNMTVYTVSVVNFMVVSYMFVKRRLIHTTIVFIGSILLLIGLFFATVLPNELIIGYVVTIETLLFMSVISYLDKKNFRKAAERDKLKQINDFKNKVFTDISHEFRTPLTLISAPIARKLEDEALPEEDRSDFEMIRRNNKRLLDLVGQLLDLSKLDTGNLKLRVSQGKVLALIRALAEPFDYMAEQNNLTYREKINKDACEVWFDRDIVEKITVNLLSNAIKYTPEEGIITCTASVKADVLAIEVKNTVKGLSKSQTEKIFDRYYQADENREGLGIGLALVRELAELHKGTVAVDYKLDEWIVLMVKLPVAKKVFNDSEIEIAATTEKPNPILVTNITIPETTQNPEDELPILLIVEDSDDLRILLKSIFEEAYHIIMAENGEEGVKLALEHIPDLIISDIMMPVKDGIILTGALKNDERTSHIPIILLTAKAGEENEFSGIETGADDYITKPFNGKILLAKVEKLIASRQKLRDRYSRELVLKPKAITITPVDEQFLIKVQGILDQNLVEPSFNVEEFSQSIPLSRMQLHRKLKALTGLSPSEFLRSERLNRAAQMLLKDSKIRVSEVGYAVGFNNISYFIKCFKEKFYCTPSEYAKR